MFGFHNEKTKSLPGNEAALLGDVEPVENCVLSPFWRHRPALWFIQTEARFYCDRITSDHTRYNLLVSMLDDETMMDLEDILMNPPVVNKYEYLKSAIIGRWRIAADNELRTVFKDLELGDKKPSDLLREMFSLAGNRNSDSLRNSWMAMLPTYVRESLDNVASVPLEKKAMIADTLMENRDESSPTQLPTCYYHCLFGDDARNCKSPCSYEAAEGKCRQLKNEEPSSPDEEQLRRIEPPGGPLGKDEVNHLQPALTG